MKKIERLVRRFRNALDTAWEDGMFRKLFCVNREPERTTIFTDPDKYTDFGGRPSAYQQRLIEVYEIVRSYL